MIIPHIHFLGLKTSIIISKYFFYYYRFKQYIFCWDILLAGLIKFMLFYWIVIHIEQITILINSDFIRKWIIYNFPLFIIKYIYIFKMLK